MTTDAMTGPRTESEHAVTIARRLADEFRTGVRSAGCGAV